MAGPSSRRGFLRTLTTLTTLPRFGTAPELARLIDEYDAALARLHAAIAEVNDDRDLAPLGGEARPCA